MDAEDLQEIISAFITEAGDLLEQIDQDLVALENEPNNNALMNRIFRSLHTIKGNAKFLNEVPAFAEMGKVAHATEDLMGGLRDGKIAMSAEIMDKILEAVDVIKKLFENAQSGNAKIQDCSPLAVQLRQFLEKRGDTLNKEQKKDSTPPITQEKKPPVAVPAESRKAPIEEKKTPIEEKKPSESRKAPIEEKKPSESRKAPIEEKKPPVAVPSESKRTGSLETPKTEEKKSISSGQDTKKDTGSHTPEQKPPSLPKEPDIKQPVAKEPKKERKGYIPAGLSEQEKEELIREFLDESRELVEKMDQDFVKLETAPNDHKLLEEIFRYMHTLKSTTSFLGFNEISRLAHKSEDVMKELSTGSLSISPEMMDCMLSVVDFLKNFFKKMEKGESDEGNPDSLVEKLTEFAQKAKKPSPPKSVEIPPISKEKESKETEKSQTPENSKTLEKSPISEKRETSEKSEKRETSERPQKSETLEKLEKSETPEKLEKSEIPEEKEKPKSEDAIKEQEKEQEEVEKEDDKNKTIRMKKMTPPVQEQTIRVETNRLDKLMNLVGELVLGRNRLIQVIRNLMDKIGDDRSCQDLVSAADFIDFVTSDLQMAVLKTRMQPISKIFNRFTRTVRDLARELGKDVRLIIKGAETEVDKSVIDEMGDPLIHMLRNSVDHGIELPEVRKSKGKNPIGTITLSAFYEGNHILIELRDDGKGIDPEVIKRKAVEKGLIAESEAERLHPREAIEFIFLPGFSTATQVTAVSGRGVGMDVVKTAIEKLNGTIEINSKVDEGTVITLRLPLTLAIIQALQVSLATETFAIPLSSVIETIRIHVHQIQTISGREVIRFRDTLIPLIHLDTLFEFGMPKTKPEKIYIVVAAIAEKRIGIVVDQIVGQEEVVVKSLGKLLQNMPGISGACIGGDGKVTLILDVASIFRLLPHNIGPLIGQKTPTKAATLSHKKKNPTILVVEDSRSERKRTRLILESRGFKVVESTDGRDALSKLMDYQIDMVITDIEMPELDGYQLTSQIREHKKFKILPVIAISSHKEMIDRIKGMEAGINTYLPKPFDEDELFNAIKNLLP